MHTILNAPERGPEPQWPKAHHQLAWRCVASRGLHALQIAAITTLLGPSDYDQYYMSVFASVCWIYTNL